MTTKSTGKTEVAVPHRRHCDICHSRGKVATAEYDAKTTMGPWANMCGGCFQQYGIGLGTGRGQRLILITCRCGEPVDDHRLTSGDANKTDKACTRTQMEALAK